MATFSVILPAAGSSSRFKDKHYKKPYAVLAGRAVWLHSAERFLARDDVKQCILVIAQEDRSDFQMKFGANVAILGIDVVEGGAERSDSVARGLEKVRDDVDYVVVHDAARPCVAEEWIDRVFAEATKSGAAILGVPVQATLKRVSSQHVVEETVSREGIWEAQTPQVFRRKLISDAFARRGELSATDEAQLVEQTGHAISVVTGSRLNLKITTKEDLRLAEQVLKVLPKPKLDKAPHPFADDDMWR
ncbi:MAG: 2-C-methyl-D-erythritol 4-phosphate cytidylyltransferase [Planctomycetales bacterium]|nr:2-C-methyl-D-erythritol 4-phosphate cytidylyltransferase [Planctomycetales bacterium]